jgi:hypothetical protein
MRGGGDGSLAGDVGGGADMPPFGDAVHLFPTFSGSGLAATKDLPAVLGSDRHT